MPQRQTFTAGQVLTAAQMTQLQDHIWVDDVNTQTGTSYTLVLTDAGKQVTMDNAASSTLTVPPNSSVAYVIGTRINITQLGAGVVTITQGAGVTVNIAHESLVMQRYQNVVLQKTDTNTWVASFSKAVVNTADLAALSVTQAKLGLLSVGSGQLTGLTRNTQTGTSYQTVLLDANKVITMNNASASTITIGVDASYAFAVGDQLNIIQLGAGQVTITPAAGVTIRSEGTKLKLKGQYAVATVIKIDTDEWVAVGNLAA